MDPVSRPKIDGHGTSEAAWRKCAWLSALPLHDADDFLAAGGRVVLVSPHPDDEVLGCGGLLFRARQLGLEVLVIAVTDGEACYPDDPLWTPEQLRATRPSELAAAMRELGVAEQCIQRLRIPDGRVAAHESELCARLAQLIQAGDRVLVTWRADGHPDHEATARATLAAAACSAASVREFPVWAWHWMSANAQRSALPSARRYRIDADAWQAKQRALNHFVSQLGVAHSTVPSPILPPHVLARFQRDYEVLMHASD